MSNDIEEKCKEEDLNYIKEKCSYLRNNKETFEECLCFLLELESLIPQCAYVYKMPELTVKYRIVDDMLDRLAEAMRYYSLDLKQHGYKFT